MSFVFELTSGQWARSTENWTSALCEFHQHLFSNIVPDSLWTILFDGIPLFLGTRTNEWPWSFSKSSRVHRYKFGVCHTFCCVIFVPQEMSLNIDISRILLVKFSGVSVNLNSNSLTSWLSCNVLNPGKIFHSNSIGSPSILSKFLYSGHDLNHSNLCSHASFDWGFSCILPRHNTESENT